MLFRGGGTGGAGGAIAPPIILEIRKKRAEFKSILMLNNKLFIFLKNSNVLIFKINGDLEKIIKLPIKLNSQPILVEESMIYLDFNQVLFQKLCTLQLLPSLRW